MAINYKEFFNSEVFDTAREINSQINYKEGDDLSYESYAGKYPDKFNGEYPGYPYEHTVTNTAIDNSAFSQVFTLPRWGIKDYIRERSIWQKGVESLTGEPGWFYFKIFFKFDTQYGLFGGILPGTQSTNSAIEYLANCISSYEMDQIKQRQYALGKFVNILSYINENAPWFFNSISGLRNANSVKLNEPLSKNEIEIGFKEDAIDMRLNTLFDLYKYACFDNINFKEIIPENLRKFDMTILIFHMPLRYYQTGFQSMKNGTYEYKSFDGNNDFTGYGNMMSFEMFTFVNCEFDIESLNSMIPSDVSNEQAFNLGKSNIKINYQKVYRHTFNEWSKLFFGDNIEFISEDTGYSEKFNGQKSRINALKTAVNSNYYNKLADIYKPLVDAVEKESNDIMRAIDPKIAFGNLYWGNVYSNQQKLADNKYVNESIFTKEGLENKWKYTKERIKAMWNSIIHGETGESLGVGSDYFKARLALLKYGDDTLHDGNNPYAPGTPYFKNRVKKEKNGDSSLH